MKNELSALTLTQPWAICSVAPVLVKTDAVVTLGGTVGQPLKRHETRGYRLLDTPRRIVIHAGKGDGGMRDSITDNFGRFDEPYASAVRAIGYSTYDPWWLKYEELRRKNQPDAKPLQLGHVLGLVTITRCIRTDDHAASDGPVHAFDRALGNWNPRRWAWRMEDPFMLEQPFQARGFQSLWKVMDHQAAMIREQGGTW